jgi:hypothetical protein
VTITATLGRARERAAEDLAALAREIFAAPPPADRTPRPDPLPSEDRELTTSTLRLREDWPGSPGVRTDGPVRVGSMG